jgi:hypothetical protein
MQTPAQGDGEDPRYKELLKAAIVEVLAVQP